MGEPWASTRVYSEFTDKAPDPDPIDKNESALDRVKGRQLLRACYIGGFMPQSYLNESGRLVGHDVELAHMLAADLGVTLELIPIQRQKFVQRLEEGWCDIVVTGLTITPERARRASFSRPYLIDGLAFVVPDSRRKVFTDVQRVRNQKGLRIAVLRGLSLYEDHVRRLLPDAEIVRLEGFDDYFYQSDGKESADALVTLAMIGSAQTLLYPSYSVVVPKPVAKVPVALALPRDDPIFKAYVDNWLMLQEQSGRLRELYDYWVLGKSITAGKERWSVVKDVLGWVR
jgi:ABC-type amino acid transport substrate-binding protein